VSSVAIPADSRFSAHCSTARSGRVIGCSGIFVVRGDLGGLLGVAIAKYLLQMPADRIGSTTMGLGQLEILQEVIARSNHTAPRCFVPVGAVAVVRSSRATDLGRVR